MNRKTFAILAIVAVALGLLAILGQHRGNSGSIAGASAGEPLLPDLAAEVENVNEITVTGAGGERLVSLEQKDSTWTVTEQDGYAADPAKITGLLIALSEARIVEEKTANPDFYSRLGVEDVSTPDATGLEVALTTGDGSSHTVVLGDTYTGKQRYARVADGGQSVLIDRDPDVARDPSDWVKPDIIDIDESRIQRIEITHADGERLVLRKATREDSDFEVEDVPEGRELQYTGIANVSGSVLQDLKLDEVASATADPGETVATTEFRTFDGLVVTVTAAGNGDEDPWLSFGASFDAEQALAFATDSDDDGDGEAQSETDDSADNAVDEAAAINARLSGWRYRIPTYQYSQLTRRMDDLLRALPTEDE